jgi:hypothetical protein
MSGPGWLETGPVEVVARAESGRREIGDPHGDHDHELIEEGETVEERDVLVHGPGVTEA